MRAPAMKVNIAANTQKVDVDNRMSLRFYYRIADNMLKQANVYREEKNIIDLYIILLRFSSLVSETIPHHQDYQTSYQKERNEYKKKLYNVLAELEALKPKVQQQVDEVNRKYAASFQEASNNSLEWPPPKGQDFPTYEVPKNSWTINEQRRDNRHQTNRINGQTNKRSLSIPLPKEETLSRHSFLGPNGLRGNWQSSLATTRLQVQYPSHGDLTPIEIPCLDQSGHALPTPEAVSVSSSQSTRDDLLELLESSSVSTPGESTSLITSIETSMPSIVRQPSPPAVVAPVQHVPVGLDTFTHVSPVNVADPRPGPAKSFQDKLANSKSPQSVQISTKMMDEFMRLAKSNTLKNLETCAVLAGLLKKRVFYVTTLIVPKQESTSDTCQTINEEEIYDVQDKRSLFTVGWIHTHPTQTCFMSSVDLHTHYSYQVMLPEAIAIVMAPTDSERKYGIFHLSDPGGITVMKKCQQRGFHPHEDTPDGSPIYEHCSHVLMSPSLKFDIVDLR
eukprot:TRINITY_DN2400_c0_g1_i1.p1 TRINITY_DN2400_c0_g1~~TRINITY_DN2400_c0_g1_i1.p1  ORF type:complete len:505 (+),score=89.14 TRINITY_DN2400_c0_g1_i1:273-1787(+)